MFKAKYNSNLVSSSSNGNINPHRNITRVINALLSLLFSNNRVNMNMPGHVCEAGKKCEAKALAATGVMCSNKR